MSSVSLNPEVQDREGAVSPLSIYVIAFVLGLIIPIQLYVADFRLSTYRIALLLAIVPCVIRLVSGQAGRILASDIFVVLHVFWAGTSLFMAHPMGKAAESVGIYFVETVGAYLLGRCFVTNARQFKQVAQLLFLTVVVMVPFAVYENLTKRPILLDVLGRVFKVHPNVPHEQRWGLDRAQVVFEHPILYGVYCSAGFGLAYFVLGAGRPLVMKLIRPSLVGLGAALSLSAGALVAVLIQAMLIGWEFVTRSMRRRWAVLGGMFALAYVVVDLVSNRSPLIVFISYLTFNPHNAWGRIAIWNAGSAEVMRNPMFGIGLNREWDRPDWLGSSVDNFWLIIALRYGIPGLILFVAAFAYLAYRLARQRDLPALVSEYRTGWFVAIVGLAVSAATVHFWNATYCLYLFVLGTGAWMLNEKNGEVAEVAEDRPPTKNGYTSGRRKLGYTRNKGSK